MEFKQVLIHSDVNALATDVSTLKATVSALPTVMMVNGVQGAVNAIGADVTRVTNGVNDLATFSVNDLATKTDVGGLSIAVRDLAFKQGLIHTDVNTLATDVSTLKATVSALPTVAMVNGVQGTVEAISAGVTQVTNGVNALATKTDVGGLSSKQGLIHADVNALATGVEALVENISLVGVTLSYTFDRGPWDPQDPGRPWGNGPWESMHVEGSNGSKLSVPIPSKWVGSEHRLQLDKRYTWTIRATGIVRDNHGLRVQRKRWPSYTIDLDAIDLDSDTLTLAVGWGTGPLG